MILSFRVPTKFCRPIILLIRYLQLSGSSSSYTSASSSWSSWIWRLPLSISSWEFHFPISLSGRMGLFSASCEVIFSNSSMSNSVYFPFVLLIFRRILFPLFFMVVVNYSVPYLSSFSLSLALLRCFLSFFCVMVVLEFKYYSRSIATEFVVTFPFTRRRCCCRWRIISWEELSCYFTIWRQRWRYCTFGGNLRISRSAAY